MTIPNFHKVHDGLYRGGQPDLNGLMELKAMGVKTIVCLRRSTEKSRQKRQEAEELGFDYVSIPLSYFGFPTDAEIERFFAIVNDPTRQPAFVHCKHGSDRTGMMCAFYRMSHQSWSFETAYAEMESAGFHKLFVYHYKYAVVFYARKLAQNKQ